MNPFGYRLLLLDVAVIPERIAVLAGRFCDRDFLVDLLQPIASASRDSVIQRLAASHQEPSTVLQLRAVLRHSGVDIVLLIGAIHRREDRLEAVVVLLGNGIEFVVVTLRTLDSEAVEGLKGVHHHVVSIQVTGHPSVDFRLGHLLVSDEIPRTGRDEPERLDAVAGERENDIACHLLLHESRVGFVLVERADDIIPIRPGVRSRLVFVVAMRLTEVDDVEPMPGPALPIPRRGEQTVDQAFIRIGCRVRDEELQLVGRGRKTEQIETEAADQRGPIRLR